MIIEWNKNPARTTVQLDHHDMQIFMHKIEIEILRSALSYTHICLAQDPPNIDRAKLYSKIIRDDKIYEENLLEQVRSYQNALRTKHEGDCTCQPCSCERCAAEDILGIDTIKGFGKHELVYIDGAFGRDNENSSQYVLDRLFNYKPDISNWSGTEEMFHAHKDRWIKNHQDAYNALLVYYRLHPEAEQN